MANEIKTNEINEEVEVKETKAEAGVGGNEYKLITPVEIDGAMVKKIRYDLESLTGDDVTSAIKELAKRGLNVVVNEIDQNYHAMIFSIASGLMYEDVTSLKLKDYIRVCNIVRDFFLEE